MNDTESEFFSKLDAVNIYRKGNQRAPHKPLYILLLIASIQQGRPRLQKYTDIEPELTEALNLFGLSNKKQNAHYPFWRLKNDLLAEISPSTGYDIRKSNNDPTKSSLVNLGATGGLLTEYYQLFSGNLRIQTRAIRKILDDHFPPSIHEDIIIFFNLRIENARSLDAKSDAEFRENVLSAYGNKCSITGYSLAYRGGFPGLEAAHVCWPQAGGNDDVTNGIAMTTLCRRLFHLGIIGVDPADYSIHVSKQITDLGTRNGKLRNLFREKLDIPNHPQLKPSIQNLEWHRRWVFRDQS